MSSSLDHRDRTEGADRVDMRQVPEGDLPPGTRPAPGRRLAFRQIWTGERVPETDFSSEGDRGADDGVDDSENSSSAVRKRGWTEESIFSSRSHGRIVGLDAARGFALIGMIAVHTLPAWSPQNYEPTLTWSLFAGHAASLFAILAGVTLVLISGGSTPKTGRDLLRSRVQIAVRALLIIVIGMVINLLDVPVYNILQYYGLMFLVAIPFLGLRVRYLLAAALFCAIAGPFLAFYADANFGYQVIYNADVTAMVIAPVDTLLTLFIGGTYPVVTWMAFIFLGMALGRCRLSGLKAQIRLGMAGALTAVVGFVSADTLLHFFGGWDRLIAGTPGLTGSELFDILDYGPPDDGGMPTTSLWWLTVNAPHADTFFSLISSAGLAMMTISAFQLLARTNQGLLQPLIAAGSMTFTLYVAHLFVCTFVDTVSFPGLWFGIQVVVMLVFAYFWSQARPRGPVESAVSAVSKFVGRRAVRAKVASVTDSSEVHNHERTS